MYFFGLKDDTKGLEGRKIIIKMTQKKAGNPI